MAARSCELSGKYDVAIIGGGITGIATAYFLRKFGCENLVVLEKEYTGYGASGRNAGFLLAGWSEPYSRLRIGMGTDSARELMRATIENHELMAEAIEANGIECQYKRSGSYHLAVSEVELREYAESVNLMNRDGFPAEMAAPPMKPGPSGRVDFLGGYYCPLDGCLDPYAFVRGLSRKLALMENFSVEKIEKSNGEVRISGPDGSLMAEMAIIATNGYTPSLDRFFERLIFPIRGQMMAASAPTNGSLGESIYYANFGYDYFRQTIDNIILIGGLRNRYLKEEIGFKDEINPALQDELKDYVREKLMLRKFSVEARWSGLMGGTIDDLPIVGALPHNSSVIVSAGFNGHGFGLGMIVARDLARAIMYGEKSAILDRFSLRRFL